MKEAVVNREEISDAPLGVRSRIHRTVVHRQARGGEAAEGEYALATEVADDDALNPVRPHQGRHRPMQRQGKDYGCHVYRNQG